MTIPDPVPNPITLYLVTEAGGRDAVAKMLRMNERTVRYWIDDKYTMPWVVAELLACHVEKRFPNLSVDKLSPIP